MSIRNKDCLWNFLKAYFLFGAITVLTPLTSLKGHHLIINTQDIKEIANGNMSGHVIR